MALLATRNSSAFRAVTLPQSSGVGRSFMVPRVPAMTIFAAARPRPSAISHAVGQALSAPTAAAGSDSIIVSNPTGHHNDAVWLQEKLNTVLGGLETATRRAKVRALRVLHVTGARMSYSPATQRPRCTGLDLDIAWEAEPLGTAVHAAKEEGLDSLHGMARVKLTTKGCDKVVVTDVQVLHEDDGEGGQGAPCMPSSKATPPDVLLAVQSLDSAIMEQLNGFMWELEQAQDSTFPLSSFELDEEAQAAPEFDPSIYSTSTAATV